VDDTLENREERRNKVRLKASEESRQKTTVILQFHQISMALQQGEKSRERIVTQRIVRQIEFSQIGEVPEFFRHLAKAGVAQNYLGHFVRCRRSFRNGSTADGQLSIQVNLQPSV